MNTVVIICLKPMIPPYCIDLELLTQDFILSTVHDPNLFLLAISDHSTEGTCSSYTIRRIDADTVRQCAETIHLDNKIRFFQCLPCMCLPVGQIAFQVLILRCCPETWLISCLWVTEHTFIYFKILCSLRCSFFFLWLIILWI